MAQSLAYPAGRTPGLNRSHPAAVGPVRLSALAVPGPRMFDISTSTTSAISNAPSYFLDGIIGPSTVSHATTGDCLTFAGRSTAADPNWTIACFFRTTIPGGQFQVFFNDDNFQHAMFLDSSTNVLVAALNNTFINSVLTPVNNVPYFAAVSAISGSKVNYILKRLDTGQVLTDTQTTAASSAAALGNYSIGGNSTFAVPVQGSLSAIMFSGVYLSLQQLVMWANNPWAFWFPQEPIFTGAVNAQAITFFNIPDTFLNRANFNSRTAIARGHDGIDAKFIPPNIGSTRWLIQAWQPPDYPPVSLRGAIGLKGSDGIERPFVKFGPGGWEIQSIQPPTFPLPNERSNAALSKWEDGIEFPFINFKRDGWEVQSWQPPFYPKKNASAIFPLVNIDAVFVFVPSNQTAWGYDIQVNLPKIPYNRSGSLTQREDGIEFPFINFRPDGWEVQSWQPPYTIHRIQSLLRGIDGIEFPFINFQPDGWEIQSVQPPHPFTEKKGFILKGIDGTDSPFINFFPYGWEIQPPQPPINVVKERGSILKGTDNIESPFINFHPYGWETQPPQPPHLFIERKGSILKGIDGTDSPFINFFPYGWEIQPPQPPFYLPKSQRIASISQWEDGIEFPFIFVQPNFNPYGWEIQPWQPPHRQPEVKGASFLRGDDGIEFPFVNFFPYGWEIQPVQPPYTMHRIQSFLRGDEGIEYPLINFFPDGWEIQAFQPPFYMKVNQRIASVSQWEDGIEFPYIFIPPGFTTQAWEVQSVQPPFKINRIPAFLRGNEGIDFPFINFHQYGWEIQPWQPPHRQPEIKGASFLQGIDGIESPFARFFPYGWEIQPWQPPHRQPEIKGASFLRGDEGIQQSLLRFFPYGWPIQPWQPPHPRPERSAAWMFGDTGTEGVYIFVPPPPKTNKPGWLVRARHMGRR